MRWARLPGQAHKVADACKRFGITLSAYRKAARELGYEARLATDEDIFLAGLYPSGPTSVETLIYYYDWVNHAGIGADEVRAVLDRLVAKGMVRRVGERYELACEWP